MPRNHTPATTEDYVRAAEEQLNTAARVPTVLRKPEVLSARAAKQAALAETKLHRPGSDSGTPDVEQFLNLYGTIDHTAATRLRTQPLAQVARLDQLLGGSGIPVAHPHVLTIVGTLSHGDGRRIDGLPNSPIAIVATVHALIMAASPFGPHSGTIARATARLVALHTGADPYGIAHTETHLARHPQRLWDAVDAAALNARATGDFARAEVLRELVNLYLDAVARGAEDAAALARNLR